LGLAALVEPDDCHATPQADTCVVATALELRRAVENGTCATVLLSSGEEDAYALDDEIVVRGS
jgi:hypothetical protein